jgi:hypothetical protein
MLIKKKVYLGHSFEEDLYFLAGIYSEHAS